jgi:hypothetical protein
MMTKTLHLFNPVVNFKLINPTSVLITNINIKFVADQYHTSLGDLSAREIISISKHFDVINFVSDQFDIDSDLYRETAVLLQFLEHHYCVTNFHSKKPVALTNTNQILSRHNNNPLVWVFGCSHSVGVGLLPDQKSFGILLSEAIGVPAKIIAQGGSSTHWSFRHLFGADIQEQDTVIWQLTTPERLTRFYNSVSTEVQLRNSAELLKVHDDDNVFFNQVSMLHAGTKYLRSKKCKFAITSILAGSNQHRTNYLYEYLTYPEYCYTPDFIVDHGTDGIHVGPLSHQRLANSLLDHVQLLYDKSI